MEENEYKIKYQNQTGKEQCNHLLQYPTIKHD